MRNQIIKALVAGSIALACALVPAPSSVAQPPMFAGTAGGGSGSWSGLIDSDTTLSVPTQYESIQAALDYLEDKYIASDAWVTISVAAGEHTSTEPIVIYHPCAARIKILGSAVYGKTISGIVSASGSSGNWSITLQLDDASGIAANDYVLVTSPSGGTNPTYIAGCWKVTGVDVDNNRITVATTHYASSAPSGAVSGFLTVLKTILKFSGCSGFVSYHSMVGMIDEVAIVGTGDTGTIGVHAGLNSATIQLGTTVGVCGFEIGLRASNGGQVIANYVVASSNAYGFYSITGSLINAFRSIASGNSNTGHIAFADSYMLCEQSIITGSTYGVQAQLNATARPMDSYVTGNTTGILGYGHAYIHAANVTYANNTTNTSPSVNTEANKGALIDNGL